MEESLRPRPPCIFCSAAEAQVVDQLTGAQLRSLWRAFDIVFPADAWGDTLPEAIIRLFECSKCGGRYFDPRYAGGETFYQVLERPGYYTTNRSEFAHAVRFALRRGLERVLDVGCGDGAFLDLAAGAGLEVAGLELNQKAAEKTAAKGHKVFGCLLHEMDSSQVKGGFDLITLFQVAEHLASPSAIIKSAHPLLSDRGVVAVAVPSAEGINRIAPHSPYEWPPHHLSRWRRRDVKTLAHVSGMKVITEPCFPLLGSQIEQLWTIRERSRAALAEQPARPLPGPVKMAAFVYRKLGLKHVFRRSGITIGAYLAR